MTTEEKVDALAKVICILEGVECVDSDDGSSNWWMFRGKAEDIVSNLSSEQGKQDDN